MVAAVPLLAGCVAAVIGNPPHSGRAADTRGRSAPGAPTAGADAALAGRLRSRFAADPVLRSELIDVSALAGTVTLSGVVTSSAARSSAERLVRPVVGGGEGKNPLKGQYQRMCRNGL